VAYPLALVRTLCSLARKSGPIGSRAGRPRGARRSNALGANSQAGPPLRAYDAGRLGASCPFGEVRQDGPRTWAFWESAAAHSLRHGRWFSRQRGGGVERETPVDPGGRPGRTAQEDLDRGGPVCGDGDGAEVRDQADPTSACGVTTTTGAGNVRHVPAGNVSV